MLLPQPAPTRPRVRGLARYVLAAGTLALFACEVPFNTLEQIVVAPYVSFEQTTAPATQGSTPSDSDCLRTPATLFPVPAETHKLKISDVKFRWSVRNKGPLTVSVILFVAAGGQDPYTAGAKGIHTPILSLGRRGGQATYATPVTQEMLAAQEWAMGVQMSTTPLNQTTNWRVDDYIEVRYQVLGQAKIP